MASLNKVFFIGRLTRDPEIRYTPSGAAVAEFGLAVNRYYAAQNGEKKEDVCFLEVNAWGKLGETVQNYLRKGRQVFVEGHLTYGEWQTPEGQKRSKIRVVAETVQFLDSGRGEGGGRPEGVPGSRPAAAERDSDAPDPFAGQARPAEGECPF